MEKKELFPISTWCNPEVFKKAGIHGYEPMTAKELDTEEVQNERLKDPTYYLEEKFDGTRALVYFLSNENGGYCRVFSRRISKKTNFYVENTDSLPQIRDINVPDLAGTILDGEMFIDGLPFKEVSSTLNCLWDKAIDRQIEKGFVSLHAFDILFYHGVDLRNMPLERRKVYLNLAIEECGSKYIESVDFFTCGNLFCADFSTELSKRVNSQDVDQFYDEVSERREVYPNLYRCIFNGSAFTPRAYYELIVATGGEGLIVKSMKGKYHHKRGWEYSKIKKFLTRELIVIGFSEPTKEYTGKNKRKWAFWVDRDGNRHVGNFYGDSEYTPVTQHYFNKQVGNLLLGVLITKDEYSSIPKNKRDLVYIPSDLFLSESLDDTHYVMFVCECAGFDDSTREYFTANRDSLVGSVVEVKANELFRDSGKMRHPRYLRIREDKEPERCTWSDHVGSSEVTA